MIMTKADISRLCGKNPTNGSLTRDLGDKLPEPDHRGIGSNREPEAGPDFWEVDTIRDWFEEYFGIPFRIYEARR